MSIEKSAIPYRLSLDYQTIGQILGPLIFLLLMSVGGAQSFMPETAWRTAAEVYGWQFGGQQRLFLCQ